MKMKFAALTGVVLMGLAPCASFAEEPTQTEWQAEKCLLYTASWEKALDFFGTDNLNYNFIAQSENFIASDCTAPASVCPRSDQELEIANALTIAMMNGGAASTFLPFSCDEVEP